MEVSTRIEASPAKVYGVVTDLPSAADRIKGIKSLEVLTEGEFGVGTRFRETRVMFGKEATEEMEIIDVVPGERYTTEAESCGCRYESVISVVPDGDGSRLTMSFDSTPLTFFGRVMSAVMWPLLKGSMRKAISADLADIKRAVEASA
ncbi:MAG: SRPBCC family protein [Phycisphaerales bacterium JB041]